MKTVKKIIQLTFLCLLFASCFHGVQAKEVIKVVGDIDFAPYSYQVDDQYFGADVDLMMELSQALGVDIQLDLKPWQIAQEDFQNGLYDIILGVDNTTNILQLQGAAIPVHNDAYVTFAKDDIDSITDLYDKKIGVLNGSSILQQFVRPYGLIDNVQLYDGYSEAFEALNNQQLDLVFASYSVGNDIIKANNYRDIKASGPQLRNLNYSIMVSDQSSITIEQISQAIATLAKSGQLEVINKKWISNYSDLEAIRAYIQENSLLIMTLGMFAFCLIILFTIINYKKRLQLASEQIGLERRMNDYDDYIRETTKELFEIVIEFDITNNQPLNQDAKDLFADIGDGQIMDYNQMLMINANRYIDADYREDYLHMHNKQQIEQTFNRGNNTINFQFVGTNHHNYQVTTKIFYWRNENSYHIIQFVQDVTDQVVRENELKNQATRDLMTSLYNKITVQTIINEAIVNRIQNVSGALLLIDVDNFKMINDNYGHLYGDMTIQKVAQQLNNSFRSEDIIGRVGGDEFIVYIKDIHDIEALKEIAERLLSNMQVNLEIKDELFTISSSVGIVVVDDKIKDFKQAYLLADEALYQSKKAGKNRFVIYEDELGEMIQ